jgi:hypothetical protein
MTTVVFLRENFSLEPHTPAQAFVAETLHNSFAPNGHLEELEDKVEGILEMLGSIFTSLSVEKQLEILNFRTVGMAGPRYPGIWRTQEGETK